jgi:hypothetical protein
VIFEMVVFARNLNIRLFICFSVEFKRVFFCSQFLNNKFQEATVFSKKLIENVSQLINLEMHFDNER